MFKNKRERFAHSFLHAGLQIMPVGSTNHQKRALNLRKNENWIAHHGRLYFHNSIEVEVLRRVEKIVVIYEYLKGEISLLDSFVLFQMKRTCFYNYNLVNVVF